MTPSILEKSAVQIDSFVNLVLLYGRDILLGMLILVVGLLVAKLVYKLLRKALRRFIAKEALVSTISSVAAPP